MPLNGKVLVFNIVSQNRLSTTYYEKSNFDVNFKKKKNLRILKLPLEFAPEVLTLPLEGCFLRKSFMCWQALSNDTLGSEISFGVEKLLKLSL